MRTTWLLAVMISLAVPVLGQQDILYVDPQGVLRRQKDGQEQAFFGVNYTAPFAYVYRHLKQSGVNIEQAIDADVYHFARLGLDAFRVHVWDTEISDSAGNLLNNEHLRLFDYLIKKLKERNIKILITPIAYWGNGYPDRNERTPGFSDYFDYNKRKLVTNDTAIAAQENYIKQLLLHVNPYTKLSYKDDPAIIACEINNEPAHGENNRQTTDYINRMAEAVRSIRWKKPIFYNISQAYRNEEAFLAAKVDGFTWQWYSNGLVANHTTPGNTLPYVDNYEIPYKNWPGFSGKAKAIYEFDAADVRNSYMYPAMARSFRKAGFQWATQFAYDPGPLAYANTEYQTHYLNLAYTPSKAISFLIAGKVFHRLPMYADHGGFPQDTLFGDCRVSYTENLSEMNTAQEFYYSNTTATRPKAPGSLVHIAGVGNSPVVQYAGTGAYFLDRVSAGSWRLEVMPDAVLMKDPFTNASLTDTATYLLWRDQAMQLQLPDLGSHFSVTPLNKGNKASRLTVRDARFLVTPGVYLLTAVRGGQLTAVRKNGVAGQLPELPLGMEEFYAPPSMEIKQTRAFAEPPREHPANWPLALTVTAIGVPAGDQPELAVQQGDRQHSLALEKHTAYSFTATLPGEWLQPGALQMNVRLKSNGALIAALRPVQVVSLAGQYELFNAAAVQQDTVLKYGWRIKQFPDWNRKTAYRFVPASGNTVAWQASAEEFNFDIPFIGWQYYCAPVAACLPDSLLSFTRLKVSGRSAGRGAVTVRLTLIDTDANAYYKDITLTDTLEEYSFPLHEMTKGPLLLVPRPYPMFLPLWFTTATNAALRLKKVEKIQCILMPVSDLQLKEPQCFMISRIGLE